jgi:threonylcarbamoyladenosine tRNA methylthiotransferase MtaB
MQKSVAFYTLGCKLNFAETSTIGRQMTEHGLIKKEFTQGADIYLINTCSVTDNADKKCRKVVKEALKYNKSAFIVVVGCYAQLKPKEIAGIEGVDLVLGAAEKFNLIQHLGQAAKLPSAKIFNQNIKETNIFVPGFSVGDRTRSFMKIQDGCDYFCSFCTIPLARGESRSALIADTTALARRVAETGVKEVVLTGVNIGDFGSQRGETFIDLIRDLDEIEGIERYRISSIEPNLLSDEVIEFVSKSRKFVPHFHIPLQSGSDKILKLMRRRYNRELYANRVARIKYLMPNAAIGVDVIVGFPQEEEEDFLETYDFIRELNISYLHVFPYSERANTTARKMTGKVHETVKNQRSKMLRILSEKKRRSFYEENMGEALTVLFEGEQSHGSIFGFTENYIKVEMPYDPLLVNELVKVQLESINENGCVNGLEVEGDLALRVS